MNQSQDWLHSKVASPIQNRSVPIFSSVIFIILHKLMNLQIKPNLLLYTDHRDIRWSFFPYPPKKNWMSQAGRQAVISDPAVYNTLTLWKMTSFCKVLYVQAFHLKKFNLPIFLWWKIMVLLHLWQSCDLPVYTVCLQPDRWPLLDCWQLWLYSVLRESVSGYYVLL